MNPDIMQPTSEDTTTVLPGELVTTTPVPEEPKRKKGSGGRKLGAALAVALLGFGGGIGGFFVADEWLADDDSSETAAQQPIQPSNDDSDSTLTPTGDSAGSQTPRSIYRNVSPAVVHINSRTVEEGEPDFFGFGGNEPEVQEGTGSGFVIDDEGHIVTNAHVVEGATELSVSFGSEITVKATVVGEDPSTDIAVIKIDPDAKELGNALKTVGFGNSEAVQVGDPVIAIGNPFSLDRTLTTGVVSALQRSIPSLNGFEIRDVIQTDAAVNPGNSGGPLLNMSGEVIGINSQIQSRTGQFAGIAFAVPSNKAKQVAADLIEDGKVEHAWLGISGQDLTPEIVDALNLDVKAGVLVGEVTPGSPAAKAGIEGGNRDMLIEGTGIRPGGDVIIEVDGKKVTGMRQVADAVDGKKPGDDIEIKFVQDGDEKTEKFELGARPARTASSSDDN
jgi:S1-C subfamily serine protease